MQLLFDKKFALSAFVILALNMLASVAFADSSSMAVMAGSAEMQGTTDFYYSNEWLVKFMQFIISWLCIIALLVYYAGWLCSMVVLSNKELFYLIDTIKKEASESGGEQKGFSGVNAVLHTFKNGSKDGVNGGLDNILLFFLSLSINFKAYSYYKDVEAGSGDGDGGSGGSKFNYNDTMLNFLLKTAIPAITITFVTSVAISGVLLQCWFTIGDVFIVNAERFANQNLAAKVDQWTGNAQGYNFTISAAGTHLGDITEDAAVQMYAATRGKFGGATQEQLQSIGRATEDLTREKLMGGTADGYEKVNEILANTLPEGTAPTIKNESQASLVSLKVYPSTNPSTANSGAVQISMQEIMDRAGVQVPDTNQKAFLNTYFHVIYKWDAAKAGSQTTSGTGQSDRMELKDKTSNDIIDGMNNQ